MKKVFLFILVAASMLLPSQKATAQSQELQQLVLNIEKLAQFRKILSDMKKGYEILEGGYNTVKDISQGNFSLHKAFLDGLMQVSPTVRNYYKVAEIVDYQLKLVNEYQSAYNRFRSGDVFTEEELSYVGRVYNHLQRESLRNLDELLAVITAGQMRMSDDERMKAIDRIHADMQDKLLFLRSFNTNTSVLALQRAKERNDAQAVQKAYDINP